MKKAPSPKFGAFLTQSTTTMRKDFSAIILFLICLTACSHPDTKPIEMAAQGYLDAMGNYLINDAIPYATTQTREKTIPVLNQLMDIADTTYINSNRPATITIKGTKMLTNTSARVYYHKSTPIMEDDDSVLVILEDKQWLVDVQIKPVPILGFPQKKDVTELEKIPVPKKILGK